MALSFDQMKISTLTIIAVSNVTIDIDKLFQNVEIDHEMILRYKTRVLKNSGEAPYTAEARPSTYRGIVHYEPDTENEVPEGTIILARYGEKIKGVEKKKRSQESTKYFRNSLTIVMKVDGKYLNMKISRNGKIQFTGCKRFQQAETAVYYLWPIIQTAASDSEAVNFMFISVMTNLDFNIGYNVNREVLDQYINKHTSYNSLLETSFGYTGCNIKIPLNSIPNFPVPVLSHAGGQWTRDLIPFSTFVERVSGEDRQKYMYKSRHLTFLVFHSGAIIMSGYQVDCMENVFNEFTSIMLKHRNIFEYIGK